MTNSRQGDNWIAQLSATPIGTVLKEELRTRKIANSPVHNNIAGSLSGS